MDIKFRKTTARDEEDVFAMIEDAQAYLKSQGVDQWQNGYPNPITLAGDTLAGIGYCLDQAGQVVAYAAISFEPEPTYAQLHGGAWLQEVPYGVIHRTVVKDSEKGKGLAGLFLEEVAQLARARGVTDLRVDTHAQNKSMRRMLEKNGFTLVGTIYLADGAPRVAYEKRI